MILRRLFGRDDSGKSRATVDALYGQIVAAARQPALYAEWNVPDTPLGRFEMMGLHLFLLLHRVRGETGPIGEVAQTLTDEFFADVDTSVRELGVGDAGVPKRVKKLATMFYGRVAAYGEALDKGDDGALAVALARNIRPDARGWPEAGRLADYVARADRLLRDQRTDALLGGALRYPEAGRPESGRIEA